MDMSKVSTRKSREEALDRELEELEKASSTTQEDDTPAPTHEEDSWKKRYGDLRALHQKDKENATKELEKLKADFEEFKKNVYSDEPDEDLVLPKKVDKDVVLDWKRRHPDVFGIVADIIEEMNDGIRRQTDERLARIEQEQYEVAKEKAMIKLLKKHPDFAELRETEDFQSWMHYHSENARTTGNKLSTWIYDSLWNNDTDADSAIEAVQYYKDTLALQGKKTKKPTVPSANESVTSPVNRREPANSDGIRRWKESDLEAMSQREYEAHEEEINKAMREGRIIMDVTGAYR